MYKTAALYTIPCHNTGHINIMLVLQSCTDPLHILPGSSSETFPTSSDGACNSSSREFEENIDAKEEGFMAVNEDVPIGIKQEEIPEGETSLDMKAEANEVSYVGVCVCVCVCVSVITHILPLFCNVNFFVTSVFLDNSNSCTVGNENFFLLGGGCNVLY